MYPEMSADQREALKSEFASTLNRHNAEWSGGDVVIRS